MSSTERFFEDIDDILGAPTTCESTQNDQPAYADNYDMSGGDSGDEYWDGSRTQGINQRSKSKRKSRVEGGSKQGMGQNARSNSWQNQ